MAAGAFQIQPAANGLCLTVYGNGTDDGYAVVQAPCVGGKPDQRWVFEKL